MKLKLNISERFALIGILPQKADYAGLKELRKLREKLSLTDDEVKEFEFKSTITPEGATSTWNSKKDREVEVRVGEIVAEMVKTVLKDLNSKKELTERHMTLFEKLGLE